MKQSTKIMKALTGSSPAKCVRNLAIIMITIDSYVYLAIPLLPPQC